MARTLTSIEDWRRTHLVADLSPYVDAALHVFDEIRRASAYDERAFGRIIKRHPRARGELFSKNLLVRIYRQLCSDGVIEHDPLLLGRLRMKPTRTLSGVATVTVLTRPHPCPGRCIFCPTDVRMPKSYLPDEPGAQRAAQHDFDPHAQVAGRIEGLYTNGHAVDKIELLILGGTWSSYPRDYQEWFVQRCLDAMNGIDSTSLLDAQARNETAERRNVGLVIETRPDHVDADEIRWLRGLGVTKVQMGAQSLDDDVLTLNERGHDVDHTRQAMTLLRAAGFKLVLHWMPNLHGATPTSDRLDFDRLWNDPALRPDEIKIYPCSLIANTTLYDVWKRGEYEPYADEVLIDLVAECKRVVPRYCRINRVYRDIPSTDIVTGCTISNLRQEVQHELDRRGARCRCIRCREVRGTSVEPGDLEWNVEHYTTAASTEHFLACQTVSDQLVGYLRLSLPSDPPPLGLPELDGAAIVREVHVYGRTLAIGTTSAGDAQHSGLGRELLERAAIIARQAGFSTLAVIASIGTRRYYAARGFEPAGTYMVRALESTEEYSSPRDSTDGSPVERTTERFGSCESHAP